LRGIPYSPAMKAYIEETKDTLFPKIIAWNLSELTGIPVSPKSIKEYIRKMKN